MADTYYESGSSPPHFPPDSEASARAGEAEPAAARDHQPPPLEGDSEDPGTSAKYDPEAPLFVDPGSDSGSESELSPLSGVMSAGLPSETSGSLPSTIPTSPESDTAGGRTFEMKDAAAEMVEVMEKGRESDSRAWLSPVSPPLPPAHLVEALFDAEHMASSPPPPTELASASQLPTYLPSKDPGEPTVVVHEIPSPDAFDPAESPDESDEEDDTSYLDSFDDVEFAAQYQDEEGIDSPLAKATEEGEIGDAMLDDLGDAEVELGLGSSPTRRRDSLKAQQDVMEVIEEVDEEAVLRAEEIAESREREVGTSVAWSTEGDWSKEKFVEDGKEDEEVEHVEHVGNTGNVGRDNIGDPHSGSDKSFHILRPKRPYQIDALSESERSFEYEEAHTSGRLPLSLPSSSPVTRNKRGKRFPLQLPIDPKEDDPLYRYPEPHNSTTTSTDELHTWLKTDQPPGLPQEDLQSWLTGGYLCGSRQEPVSQLPFNPFRSKSASASRGGGGELKPWEYKSGLQREVRTPMTWQNWDVFLPDEMTAEQRMRDWKEKGAQRDTAQGLVDADSDEWKSISDDDDNFGYPLKQFPRQATPTALARRFKAQSESYGYKLERTSSKSRSHSPVNDITLRARSLCPAPTGSSSPPPFGRRSSFAILQELDQATPLTSPFTEINVIANNRPSSQPLATSTPFSNIGQFPFIQNNNPIITPHHPDSDVDSDSASSVITVIGPRAPAGAAWMNFYAFLGMRQRALLGNRAKTRSIYYGGLWHGFWLEKKGAFDYFPSKDWEWTEPLRRWRRGGTVETKRPAIIIRPKEGEGDGEKVLIGTMGRGKVVVDVEGRKEVMVLERGVKVEGEVTVVKREVVVDVLIPVEMCEEID